MLHPKSSPGPSVSQSPGIRSCALIFSISSRPAFHQGLLAACTLVALSDFSGFEFGALFDFSATSQSFLELPCSFSVLQTLSPGCISDREWSEGSVTTGRPAPWPLPSARVRRRGSRPRPRCPVPDGFRSLLAERLQVQSFIVHCSLLGSQSLSKGFRTVFFESLE